MMLQALNQRRASHSKISVYLCVLSFVCFYLSAWFLYVEIPTVHSALGFFFAASGGINAFLVGGTVLLLLFTEISSSIRLIKSLLGFQFCLGLAAFLVQVITGITEYRESLSSLIPVTIPFPIAFASLLWTFSLWKGIFQPSRESSYTIAGVGLFLFLMGLVLLNMPSPITLPAHILLTWHNLFFVSLGYNLLLVLMALLLILLAFASHSLTLRESPKGTREILTLLLFAVAILNWSLSLKSAVVENEKISEKETAQMNSRIQEKILAKLDSLTLFGQRFSRVSSNEENWGNEALGLLKANTDFKMLFWVDNNLRAHWPLTGSFTKISNQVKVPAEHKSSLDLARHLQLSTLFPRRDHLTGEYEIWVYTPVYREFEYLGFVVGVLPIFDIVDSVKIKSNNLTYKINIQEHEEYVFKEDSSEASVDQKPYTHKLKLPNTEWTVQFQSTGIPFNSKTKMHVFLALQLLALLVFYRKFSPTSQKFSLTLFDKNRVHSLSLPNLKKWANFIKQFKSPFRYTRQKNLSSSHWKAVIAMSNEVLELGCVDLDTLSFSFEPFHLVTLLEENTKMLSPILKEKGIKIILNITENVPKVIYGDPKRLKQLFHLTFLQVVEACENGDLFLRIFPLEHNQHKVELQFEIYYQKKDKKNEAPLTIESQKWKKISSVVTPQGKTLELSKLAEALTKRLEGEWQRTEETSGIIGYRFSGIWPVLGENLPTMRPHSKKTKTKKAA